jgi:hypothetical protein
LVHRPTSQLPSKKLVPNSHDREFKALPSASRYTRLGLSESLPNFFGMLRVRTKLIDGKPGTQRGVVKNIDPDQLHGSGVSYLYPVLEVPFETTVRKIP